MWLNRSLTVTVVVNRSRFEQPITLPRDDRRIRGLAWCGRRIQIGAKNQDDPFGIRDKLDVITSTRMIEENPVVRRIEI